MFQTYQQLVKMVLLRLVVRDKKNDTSTETASMIVGETDKEFSFLILK